MAGIGVSLIVASVLWVFVRPPSWLASFFIAFRAPRPAIDKPGPARGPDKDADSGTDSRGDEAVDDGALGSLGEGQKQEEVIEEAPAIQLHVPTTQADDDK